MKPELKPCPFCGEQPLMEGGEYGGSAHWVWKISCCAVMSDLYGPKVKAINAWNRRKP